MRVLMTADTVGGVWTYALDLAAAIAPMGVETTLVTMGRALSREQWAGAEATPGLRVIETSYKLEWMQDPWDDVEAAGSRLLDVAATVQPDVVHLNGFCHASLDWGAVLAPVIVVGHSCVETWWRAVKGERAGSEWRTYRERVRRGIFDADAFVAPTRAMLDAFTEVYGAHPRPRVIHNGRDPSLFRPLEKQDVVLAAGRLWDEAKNLSALDAAAQRVAWPVLVAGDERSPDGDCAAATSVTLLGRLTPAELAGQMGRAAIYALPARYEPFGLSAVEAALCGCALVLGDIPTLREVWGDNALFIHPSRPDRLADAINSLIEDPPRRHAMGQRARAHAMQFTPYASAAAYVSLYRRLARPHAAATRIEEEIVA